VGAVAGGEHDGIHLLACPIRPDDAVGVERGEHGTAVHQPGLQGVAVFAGVDHPPVAEVVAEPLRREQVKAAGHQPVVQVLAAPVLRVEGDRVAGGERHGGDLGQFVADLDRGVARADHDDAFAGVLVGAAVAGHVQQPPGEVVLAGQSRHVRVAERTGRGHHARRVEALPGGGAHEEPAPVVGLDRGHRGVGADVGAEARGVAAQVVGDLVAVR
jgi:hypothetical protein